MDNEKINAFSNFSKILFLINIQDKFMQLIVLKKGINKLIWEILHHLIIMPLYKIKVKVLIKNLKFKQIIFILYFMVLTAKIWKIKEKVIFDAIKENLIKEDQGHHLKFFWINNWMMNSNTDLTITFNSIKFN